MKKQPKTPDPAQVSASQTKSNQDTALFNANLNRVDQSSPFGSSSWSHTGNDPASGWSQSTALSPELQGLMSSQIGSQQGISDAISGAIGRLPSQAFDPSSINVGDIRDRSFNSQMANLTPQFEKGARELEGTMSDRGIPIGSEIWNNQQGEYNRAKDTSLLGASRQADQDANNEFQRQYGNKMTEYQMPYQNLSSLMGNSQAVSSPQFSSVPQAASANTNTAQNTWDAYNANVNKTNSANSNTAEAAMAAAKMAMMFSDIRLKRDIERIGEMPSGLPVYSYRYLWSDAPEVGVMAHEAIELFPGAVSVHESGYLQVNYAKLA